MNMLKGARFVLLIHFLIIASMWYNLVLDLQTYSCREVNQELLSDNRTISTQVSNLRQNQNYQNTELYRQKQAKLRNYRNLGEQVIDTSLIEPIIDNPSFDYIPDLNNTKSSNLQKWFGLLEGEGISEVNIGECVS